MRNLPPEELVPGALEKYTHDLTALALQGRFTPLQRRDKEVERVLQVLARIHKNNPMLIGEDRAERFAVVAEVVRRISIGGMPEGLKASRVVALDLEKLIADTQTPGDFERLLGSVVAEAALSEWQTLLFIDNLSALLSGGWAKEPVDAAKVLMPAIARGEIVVLGTLTQADYREHILCTPARYRRCQEILVGS